MDRIGAEKLPDEREETAGMWLCNFSVLCWWVIEQHESFGATVPEYVITELSRYVVPDFIPFNSLLYCECLNRGVGKAASEHMQ